MREPKHFFINELLDTRQGNPYSLGILYLALSEMLDIPVFAVEIPRQFLFAYIDTLHDFYSHKPEGVQHIQFYLDPISGMVYVQRDIDVYLKKINALDRQRKIMPLKSKRIIYKMMEELCLCYRYRREDAKADEIEQLMKMLVSEE